MDQYPGTESDIRYLNRKVLLEPFRPEHVDDCPALHVIHNGFSTAVTGYSRNLSLRFQQKPIWPVWRPFLGPALRIRS